MMKSPVYINNNILKYKVSADWDDAKPYDNVLEIDQNLEEVLRGLNDLSRFVFSIGCAELVVAKRCGNNSHCNFAWQYIEACWAYEMSEDFELPEELEGEFWTGQIKGPIVLALLTIINTAYGFDERNSEIDSVFADAIARTYCGESLDYLQWRENILKRLIYFDNNCAPGERIPREILDLGLDTQYVIEMREFFIDSFLKEIHINPYIHKE